MSDKCLYLLVNCGEVVYEYWGDRNYTEPLMKEAYLLVGEKYHNHDYHYQDTPVEVTPSVQRELDVKAYCVGPENQVTLPLQEWFNTFYRDHQNYESNQKLQEEKRFLELLDKFGDQIEELRAKHRNG
jgi:hypothetical protein